MCELLSNNSLFVCQLYEDKSLALCAQDLIFFTDLQTVNYYTTIHCARADLFLMLQRGKIIMTAFYLSIPFIIDTTDRDLLSAHVVS